MYHGRFKGSHYEAVFHFGRMLLNHDKVISPNFKITLEKICKQYKKDVCVK
ncbi:MAG: hypothetical protein LUF02_08165 [Erysipelotrichaceae bacterium]|nr:hypothetical protein [Erysipelotrichaceae bacterium]